MRVLLRTYWCDAQTCMRRPQKAGAAQQNNIIKYGKTGKSKYFGGVGTFRRGSGQGPKGKPGSGTKEKPPPIFELETSWLLVMRSTNWAIAARLWASPVFSPPLSTHPYYPPLSGPLDFRRSNPPQRSHSIYPHLTYQTVPQILSKSVSSIFFDTLHPNKNRAQVVHSRPHCLAHYEQNNKTQRSQ